MKRYLLVLGILGLSLGCQKNDKNDEEEVALLLVALQNQNPTTCNVSLSGFNPGGSESNVPDAPITRVGRLGQEITVQFGPVPNTTHRIAVVNVKAKEGTEVTFAGGQFFSVVFERGLGCPIGTANKQTKDVDFTYIGSGVTTAVGQDLLPNPITIQFKKSGNFFITPYLLNAGPIQTLSTEGNLKVALTKL